MDITSHERPTDMKKNAPVSLRLRRALWGRLTERAMAEQRSRNEMASILLERAFEADRQLVDVFGSVQGYAVARALLGAAEAAAARNGSDGGQWLYDVEEFDQAAEAIRRALDAFRPAPETRDAVAAIERQRPRS